MSVCVRARVCARTEEVVQHFGHFHKSGCTTLAVLCGWAAVDPSATEADRKEAGQGLVVRRGRAQALSDL
jgi:hypothetical protein